MMKMKIGWSGDLMPKFFSQLKPWMGYAKFYEIIVLEETDPMLVWLKGHGLLCAPPRDYRPYDWFKILRSFEFEGSCYLMLRNGYKHRETARFLAAGYSLVRIVEGWKGEAALCNIEGQGEFERVTKYLRRLSRQTPDLQRK
jgi:hypothetical protein